MMFSYAKSAWERGIQVIIAGAGGAAHLPGYTINTCFLLSVFASTNSLDLSSMALSGMVAALTPVPVIGVPVRGSSMDGLDSLLSIVQVLFTYL